MSSGVKSMKKYKTGLIFGTFELFHIGHINLLRRAKARCERLIVCLGSDEFIKKRKKHETVIKFRDRRRIIESIKYVDETGSQPFSLRKKEEVKKYNPDVIFVGDDWKNKDWDGAKLGIPVIYLPYTKRISTTIIKKKLEFLKF